MLTGQRPIYHGDGEQTRDFIYVADIVDTNLKALEAGDNHKNDKEIRIIEKSSTSLLLENLYLFQYEITIILFKIVNHIRSV